MSVCRGGDRLSSLVRLTTFEIFNPGNELDVMDSLEISLRIIFNHSRDCTVSITEDKEQLFDKTKLNTFADHVATIQSVLINAREFTRYHSEQSGKKLDLAKLEISQEIRQELSEVLAANKHDIGDTGDYSWRAKLSAAALSNQASLDVTNQQLMDNLLGEIPQNLNYFQANYWNMLTDSEYTYQELALFKRVAFVRFVLDCTNYSPSSAEGIGNIRACLKTLVESSCSTTMMCKCLELVN